MKIGTDGVLLGAWVSLENNPFSILDIGAGTGIIALQLAQRSNAEMIDAIEIEEDAYEQCVDNFENSPWGDRLFCYHASLEEFVEEIDDTYDIIISNPPFYSEDYKTSSESRDKARFAESLPFDELIGGASQMLSDDGIFAIILPRKEEENFIFLASEKNLFPKRICRVRGTETSEEKRSLIEFSFRNTPPKTEKLTIEISRHNYTEEYKNLVKDFYLKM
ncbi:tRNA1(Val) (adenine(37)-N6)-methyltransferase [Aequorivita echinoideorum]|uniref:tRNA1(Val) (adenine(37)-N6)-methyltransferase n=1 Tax=Aequorivita echinoideorum TaxID=1549647 RepID=A0ABS5S1I3_9FLAO|nr:methyltransferase [Aequorivita echinoideorum]MBT0606843.1 methyltransferase [Aequorivita echinoideorum]